MSGTTTILVTGLESETASEQLASYVRIQRDTIGQCRGRIAKTVDDGVVALFDSAYEGARAAIRLQQACERAARLSGTTIGLRIGCHVGEVVGGTSSAEDGFGSAVGEARQCCARAEPGQILVTDLVRMLVGERSDITFEAAGDDVLVRWEPLPAETPCRVVVADDAPLVRSGVVRLLADEGFDVVGEASDAEELLALVEQHRPDLVITDIRMPPTQTDEGLRAAATIRSEYADTAVLVLSQHVEARAAAGLLDDNAAGVGYLLKERVGELEEFVTACRTVASGGRVVDPLVGEQLMHARREGDPLERLTEREREVLGLMAQGRSNAAVASELAMSPKTVESHVRAIFTKLDLTENHDEHRRVAAVVRWLQAGR